MKFIKAAQTLFLICIALFGDYIVFNSKYSSSQVFRAFSDTCLHGVIGCISAVIFFSHDHELTAHACISNIIFCTAVSSFIDIDHVIVARSLQFKEIANAKHRGIFHSTSFCIVITLIICLYSYVKRKLNIYTISFMILVATLSHHIRDGNRRGLWFPPFGSTPPLNRMLYLMLLGVCPHVLAYMYSYTKPAFYRNVVVNEKMTV